MRNDPYIVCEIDKAVGTRGNIERRETCNDAINGVRKDVDATNTTAKHPNGITTADEDASMTPNRIKRVQNI